MMRYGIRLMFIAMLFVASAKAQLGIYGKFDLNHYSFGGTNSTSTWLHGGGFGVYDDFLKLGPVRGGLDVRATIGTGGQYNYKNVLGGPRVAVKTPVLPSRLYIEGLLGVGGPKYTGPTAAGITSVPYSNKFTYEVVGGIDFTLIPHVDFRAIEIGVGRQTGVSSSGANNPSATVVEISTGIVIRL